MSKVWLAVALGVILGLALAYTPTPQTGYQPSLYTAKQAVEATQAQAKLESSGGGVQQVIPLALISLLIGIVVAVPIFLLAKKRVSGSPRST